MRLLLARFLWLPHCFMLALLRCLKSTFCLIHCSPAALLCSPRFVSNGPSSPRARFDGWGRDRYSSPALLQLRQSMVCIVLLSSAALRGVFAAGLLPGSRLACAALGTLWPATLILVYGGSGQFLRPDFVFGWWLASSKRFTAFCGWWSVCYVGNHGPD